MKNKYTDWLTRNLHNVRFVDGGDLFAAMSPRKIKRKSCHPFRI